MRIAAGVLAVVALASADTSAPRQRFDPRALRLIATIEYASGVTAIAFSPDGRTLAVATEDTVRFLKAGTWKESRRIRGDGTVRSFAFDPAGTMIVLGSGTRRLRRVHLDHKEVDEWGWSQGATPVAMAWSADGRLAGAAARQAWFISPGDGAISSSIDAPAAGPYALAMGPDAKRQVLATESGDVVCKSFWKQETVTFESPARSVLLSPDAAHIVAGCRDGRVRAWDIAAAKLVATRPGHGGPVHALVYSPAHQMTVSGGGRTVRFWRGVDLEEVAVLRHAGPEVDALAVSPNGHWLVTATTDGVLRIYGR